MAVAGRRDPGAGVVPRRGPQRGVPVRAGAVLLSLFFPADSGEELAVVGRKDRLDMLSENVSWREP